MSVSALASTWPRRVAESIRARLSVMAPRSLRCSVPSAHSAFGRYIIIGTTGLSAGTVPSARSFQRRASLENVSVPRSTCRAASYPTTSEARTPGASSTGAIGPTSRSRR